MIQVHVDQHQVHVLVQDYQQHYDDAYQQPYWVKHQQQLQHDDELQLHIVVDKMDVNPKLIGNDDDYVDFDLIINEIPLMMNQDKHFLLMRMMLLLQMNKQMVMDNKEMKIQVL
jgi:hypothetical protein